MPDLVKRPSAVEVSAAANGEDVQNRLADLMRELKRNRAREEAAARKPCYVLYPESSIVSAKDMMSFVALMLTFIVVPFEVSFVDAPPIPDPTDPLWIFNRVVDLLFTIDIAGTFFVGLTKPNPFLEQAKESGMEEGDIGDIIGTVYEFRLRHIFLDYLKGWMVLDVGAMGPSVFEIYSAISHATGSGSAAEQTADPGALLNLSASNASDASGAYDAQAVAAARSLKLVRATRVLKLFRLLKLVKLLRAIKMFNDPDGPFQKVADRVTLAFIAHMRKLAILKLCVIFLVLAHVQACVLGLSTVVVDRRASTWWGTLGYCFPDDDIVVLIEDAAASAYEATTTVQSAAGAAASALVRRMLASKVSKSSSMGGAGSVGGANLYFDPVASPGLLDGVDIPCVGPFYQYFICVAWALEFNFGVSTFYTETGPGLPIFLSGSAATFQVHEALLFTCCGLTGALMGVYLQARVVDVLTSGPTTAESVNGFCKRFNVRRDIRKNLQTYFERLSKIPGTKPAGDLFSTLSPSLAQQVMLDVHEAWLQKLPFHGFLTHADSPIAAVARLGRARRAPELRLHAWTLLSRLALEMRPTLLIPKESPSAGRMYVVLKGVAIEKKSGNLLTVNDNWGATDAICGAVRIATNTLTPERQEHIEALTFLQLFYIESEQIAGVLHHAPELYDAYLKLRVWGLLQRLFRCIIAAAEIEHVKEANALKPRSPAMRSTTPASKHASAQHALASAAPASATRVSTADLAESIADLADTHSSEGSESAGRRFGAHTTASPSTSPHAARSASHPKVSPSSSNASLDRYPSAGAAAERNARLDQVVEGISRLEQQQCEMDARHRASQEAMSQQIEAVLIMLRKERPAADYDA